jgi:DNA adenine methylase
MPNGTPRIGALAPWYGGNRMMAPHVGRALAGCKWVGVPFAGGMAELVHVKARTILVNDKHRHVINLARVVASDALRTTLVRRLRRKAFHPDELADAQRFCNENGPGDVPNIVHAEAYFVCCWMGRSAKAGLGDEFDGRPATRWTAAGGDSALRYYNAVRGLADWSRILRRCSFETMDAFDFLARCEDCEGQGIYCDPPFPGAGRRYRHNAGKTDKEESEWHTRLRDAVSRFQTTRVVMRFYDHPWIRDLYPTDRWHWQFLPGRTQANSAAPEVLIVNQYGVCVAP